VNHASSLPPLSAGRTVDDKFEILGVLGEGGTGIVYDARRMAEGDRIALKVIHPHLAGDAQIRGRFAREAAILRRLEGDHLCPVLDFGEVPDRRRDGAGKTAAGAGLLYMALPRIDGQSLEALLAKEAPLPIVRAVTIVLDVCEALRQAHSQGVIHRDLKPGNVLLGEGDRAVVVDFGMAKIIGGVGLGTTALTEHNMVFGTPEYMAPEQARGDELDARCDVYATGIILYEMLTGRVPFSGPTPLNVLTAHMTEPAQPPRTRAPDRGISPALDAVTMHAITKDPAERYATAGALAMAIRSAVGSPEDAERVRPAARANDPAVVRSPAVAASLPLGPSVPMPRSATLPSLHPVPLPERVSLLWIGICVLAALAGIVLGAWLSVRNGR
jgi:eukaryotic-like serine/threonine-protein kinase